MASFRSLIPDAFNVDLGQLKLEIKDGIVQLEDLADEARHFAEVELRKLSSIYEEVKAEVVSTVTSPKPTPVVPAPAADVKE